MIPFTILTPLNDLASAQSVPQQWQLCKPALLCLGEWLLRRKFCPGLSRCYPLLISLLGRPQLLWSLLSMGNNQFWPVGHSEKWNSQIPSLDTKYCRRSLMLCPFSLPVRGRRFREPQKVMSASPGSKGALNQQEMNLHVLKSMRNGDYHHHYYYQRLGENDSGADLNNIKFCILTLSYSTIFSTKNFKRHNGTWCANSVNQYLVSRGIHFSYM